MAWSTNLKTSYQRSVIKDLGFTLLEVLVAIALLLILVVGALSANSLATKTIGINQRRSEANRLAREGMEALLSVRANDFDSLTMGDFHPVASGNGWVLDEGSEQIGDFTRVIDLSGVLRSLACLDTICDIVSAGGVADYGSYKADVEVSWTESDGTKTVILSSLVTKWR